MIRAVPVRLRRHLGWPLLLLLASVGVATVAVVQAQREAASHRRTAAGLLRDYAAIAAWSYGRRAEQALVETGRQVLSPVLHHELHPRALGGWPDALDLPAYRDSALAWCRCAAEFEPDAYLAWTVGHAAARAHVVDADGGTPDLAVAARIVDSVTAHVRDARQPRGRAGIVAVPRPSPRPGQARGAVLAAYGLMPTEWGDTIAYAFTFDPASLDAGFQRIAREDELLPRAVTRGVPNARLLAVEVASTAAPATVALSRGDDFPEAAWPYQARVRLAPELAGLRVRAAVRPGAEAALVAGGLPRGGLPLLPALLVLAAALALVAVRQLRREQELARLRADFVASVSHELRTPLAQIRLFLETLRLGRWRTAEQRDWLLGHADREATRLAHLVENVLAFARAGRGEGGAVRPAPSVPADVAAEVRDAAEAFAPLAAARGTTVTVRAEGEAHARLDRAAFRQVVLNLLDNAVKYGPAGQTVVVTVAHAMPAAGAAPREVVVTVDDAGPGVPAAQRRRVWEPFARGDGDHVRSAGGSGIGLAIVREIVVRHGGRAWLDDAPGGGLRAAVALPACAAAIEPAGDAAPAAPAAVA